MDSVGPVDNSSITSRLSLQKLCSVVSQFSDFKRDLIKEIGFGGALAIQPRKKINLKLSSWLMDRVDVDSCSLNIEGHPPVVIFDQDVEDVLALPCGKRSISAEGVDPSNACIEYTRFAAALSQKGTHSLKAAEVYLMRDITSESSALEIECFKIAFVVFYVGHVLAPSAKHDYIFIDFWAALNDSSKLTDWNWCAYVLKHLFAVVRKFKTDVAKRNSTIHLVRNHIFLQVKYLDLLDLGTHSRPINIGPHIGLYDYDSMKKIVDRISVNLGNDTSFHGASECRQTIRLASGQQQLCSNKIGIPGMHPDYEIILWQNRAVEKLGILFKEYHAKGLRSISEMRQSQLSSMINFLGKFMACIADNYTCCKSAGRRQCILKVNPPNCSRENNQLVEQRQHCHAGANTYRTPIAEKTLSHRSGHSEGDESTSAQSTVNRKRQLSGTGGANSGSHVQKRFHIDQPKFDICLATAVTPSSAAVGIRPATAMAARIIRFVDDVASSIVTMQAEFRPSSEYVRFGQTTEAMVFRRGILSTALARSSWAVGSCPPGPSSTATRAIQDWIRHAAEKNLQKIWIIHPNPRLVLVDGLSIRDQLVFNKQLSHELCVVAMRRYAQIDKFNIRDSAGMRWRKFMDLDFATVHDELRPDENDYKIESRRMWYVLVVLVDGWVVYLFDMLRRRIQVLDPAVGPFGFSTERVKMHEYVSNKLHGALFHCLEKFYSNWICTKEEWTRSFPIIMAEKFTCEESGLVATFFVRHYDGERLLIPLSQETLQNHKQNTLYEIMRIEGNHSSLPSDALEAIKNSFCVL